MAPNLFHILFVVFAGGRGHVAAGVWPEQRRGRGRPGRGVRGGVSPRGHPRRAQAGLPHLRPELPLQTQPQEPGVSGLGEIGFVCSYSIVNVHAQ